MRKTMKRCLMATLGALAFVAAGFGVSGLKTANVAKAENTNLKIAGKTLNVSDNVNVVFYVPKSAGEKSAITVHVTEKEADGNKEVTLSAAATNYTYEGTEYYRFVYSGVMAYEMSNELYAYAQLGDEKSDEVKYSVLQYAYKKLGKADNEKDTTEGLEDLLTAMLGYGSAAARFTDSTLPADFSYEDDYTYVSVANATFEDGFSHGVFKKGAELTVSPNEGYKLADSYDTDIYSVDGETITLKVPNEKLVDATSLVDNSSNISAEEKIAHEKENFTLDFSTAKVGDIVENLPNMPVRYEDVEIVWSAENANVEGTTVTFTTAGNIALVASFTCDGVTETKEFPITVDLSDVQKVANAKADLLIAYNRTTAIKTEKDTLPTTLNGHDVTITWAVAAEMALLDGNIVTFNKVATVSLTATIQYNYGVAKDTHTWEIVVTEPVVEQLAFFNLGDNGSGFKETSQAKTTYSETNKGITLSIVNASKVYPGSMNQEGDGCLKLGTSSATASFEFTVPDNVTMVIIYAQKYKANASILSINGKAYTLTKESTTANVGFDEIKIDTSETKKITVETTSGGKRAMINAIEFKGYAQ